LALMPPLNPHLSSGNLVHGAADHAGGGCSGCILFTSMPQFNQQDGLVIATTARSAPGKSSSGEFDFS